MPSEIEPETAAAEGPRRSTRTTSSSKPAAETSGKKAAKASGKKRGAQDDGDKKTTGKRVKADSGASGSNEKSGAAEDSLKHIDIGDSLPSLVLKNEKGEDVDVADLTSEKGVVMFLVPKANTPGCTNQACGFRDIFPDFTSSGFDVYCLSADKPEAQSKWQTAKQLPYPLLSDTERVLISVLGAGQGGKTQRSHFIFEKGGKLLDKKIPVKPADSPKLALEFIKGLSQT